MADAAHTSLTESKFFLLVYPQNAATKLNTYSSNNQFTDFVRLKIFNRRCVSVLNNQQLLVACVYTAKWNDSDYNCGSLVLFGQSPSVWWIMVLWCQQAAASSQSSVSLEPCRPPSWWCMVLNWGCVCVFMWMLWPEGNQRDTWLLQQESAEWTCWLLLCLMCSFLLRPETNPNWDSRQTTSLAITERTNKWTEQHTE